MKSRGFWPYPEDKVASFIKTPKEEQEKHLENRYKGITPILEGIKAYLEARLPNNFYSSDVLLDLLNIKGPSLRLRASRALFLFGHEYNIHPRIHPKNNRPYYGRADGKSGEPNFIDTAEKADAIFPVDTQKEKQPAAAPPDVQSRDVRIF